MKRKVLIGSALALSLAAAGAAWARPEAPQHSDQPDSQAVGKAKITLADASTAAERHVGGRAYEAGIEEEKGTLFFEVDVATSKGPQEVKIDAATGKVIAVEAADQEDEEDDDAN